MARLSVFILCFFCIRSFSLVAQIKNQIIFPEKDFSFEFIWLKDDKNKEIYTAVLIPIKIKGCPKLFFMQLDTGSPTTLFYTQKLQDIQKKYPKSLQINDSLRNTKINFLLEKNTIQGVFSLKDFGNSSIDWTNDRSISIIGTIGLDWFEDKILTINYPQRNITISVAIPKDYASDITMESFMYVRNAILIPAILRGQKTMLFFDTGSSAYELLTSKEIASSLATPNTSPNENEASSWGRTLTAYTFSTTEKIQIASQEIPIRKVTYVEGATEAQIQQMLKMGMGGMTGNALFLNSILILDMKKKLFGLLSK